VRVVLFGVSTLQASELVETIRRLGWELAASVRNVAEPPVPEGIPAVVGADELQAELLALPFAVPQTNPALRRATVAAARSLGFERGATIVHPSSEVASTVVLGQGCYVGAVTSIGAGTVAGDWCLVNRSCSIAHHVTLGSYVATGPGVVIAGACTVEDGAFVGAGAVLAPKVTIGVGAVVGAGAVVIRDVAPGVTVAGNPARVLERR
jgi:hypothetical protein